MTKKTILSASVPTGVLTVGNYIGAIANWSAMQEKYNCLYAVADLHAWTVHQDPEMLRKRSLSFYAQYIALGLDPEKNILFMQSHVKEHAELAWILSCFTSTGALNRMTQFKDKSQQHAKNINAGLYTYPVLMAADILLYQANLVPVGEDQKQHLELTRDLVENLNGKFGDVFTMPDPFIPKLGARIMSLQDPEKKMSKSDENEKNFVSILDDPKKIMKKVKSAVTDSGSEIRYDENNKGIANLMTLYSAFSGKDMPTIEAEFDGKMYGHLKVALGELICETLAPVQEKYHDLIANKDHLHELMRSGAEKARERATKTLASVYDKVGFYRV